MSMNSYGDTGNPGIDEKIAEIRAGLEILARKIGELQDGLKVMDGTNRRMVEAYQDVTRNLERLVRGQNSIIEHLTGKGPIDPYETWGQDDHPEPDPPDES